MDLQNHNFYAIIATAILQFLIGALWYSPLLFGKLWAKESNIKFEECSCNYGHFGGAFLIALVTSFVLSLFVHWTHSVTAIDGAIIGFWAWLGFIATNAFSSVIWEKKTFSLYFISVSVLLVSLVLSGAILAYWQ